MKFYPEIAISGHNFSPQLVLKELNIVLEKTYEKGETDENGIIRNYGFGILKTDQKDISEKSITKVLKMYKCIKQNKFIGKTIEKSNFNLIIHMLQGVTLNSGYLLQITEVFPEVFFTLIFDEEC